MSQDFHRIFQTSIEPFNYSYFPSGSSIVFLQSKAYQFLFKKIENQVYFYENIWFSHSKIPDSDLKIFCLYPKLLTCLFTIFKDVEIPDEPYLPTVDRHPKITRRVPFAKKRRIDYRGPEPTVNYLLLKKCGIQATSGGRIKFEHFEVFIKYNRL